jgi:hypothetical protein
MHKASKAKRRNTLSAMIAAEPDLEKKKQLALLGPIAQKLSRPEIALALEFYSLRKFDLLSSRTGKLARYAFRDAAKHLYTFTVEALMNWEPEAFKRLATAMRAVERNQEAIASRTPEERRKWLEVLLAEQAGSRNTYRLAKAYCEIHQGGDFHSVERAFRRLRKSLLGDR